MKTCNNMATTAKNPMHVKEYKGYTIEIDYRNPYSSKPEYMYYPTEQGIQHDADYDGEQYRYCGNCKWQDNIEDCEADIDELTGN